MKRSIVTKGWIYTDKKLLRHFEYQVENHQRKIFPQSKDFVGSRFKIRLKSYDGFHLYKSCVRKIWPWNPGWHLKQVLNSSYYCLSQLWPKVIHIESIIGQFLTSSRFKAKFLYSELSYDDKMTILKLVRG